MAEFQWWLLLVGLVAGGALVAVLTMDFSRRDADLEPDEQAAEATFISTELAAEGRHLDRDDVAAVLRVHRDYLRLPPPDGLEPASAGDRDADHAPDDVRDDGGRGADEDLPAT
jgi:hypothetical protein